MKDKPPTVWMVQISVIINMVGFVYVTVLNAPGITCNDLIKITIIYQHIHYINQFRKHVNKQFCLMCLVMKIRSIYFD